MKRKKLFVLLSGRPKWRKREILFPPVYSSDGSPPTRSPTLLWRRIDPAAGGDSPAETRAICGAADTGLRQVSPILGQSLFIPLCSCLIYLWISCFPFSFTVSCILINFSLTLKIRFHSRLLMYLWFNLIGSTSLRDFQIFTPFISENVHCLVD